MTAWPAQRRVILGRLPIGGRRRQTSSVPVRDAWIKSSFSGTGDCVEWFIDDHQVKVRDSKNPGGPVLAFTHSEWIAFRRAMEAGESAV